MVKGVIRQLPLLRRLRYLFLIIILKKKVTMKLEIATSNHQHYLAVDVPVEGALPDEVVAALTEFRSKLGEWPSLFYRLGRGKKRAYGSYSAPYPDSIFKCIDRVRAEYRQRYC